MCVGKINEGFQGPVIIIYRLGWGMGGAGGGGGFWAKQGEI